MMVVYARPHGRDLLGLRLDPTGFIPEEDQGYAIVGIQLPDAAAIERTAEVAATRSRRSSRKHRGSPIC